MSVAATEMDYTWYSGCTGNVKGGTTYQGIQLVAPGRLIYTLRMGGYVGYGNGTSMAAPIVSGVASILVTCTDPTTAEYDLLLGADDMGSRGWDSTYGYGKVNLLQSLQRHCY
jgi:subtilisin family serine protease